MNDNQRLIEHSLTIADLPQIDIEDAEQVAERTRLYINYCLDCDILPTVQGLSLALGIDRRTFTRWESGLTRQKTHQGLMRSFKNLCEELLISRMMEGKINPISAIFLLKNNFGYTDQCEVCITPSNPLGEGLEPEELEEKYL